MNFIKKTTALLSAAALLCALPAHAYGEITGEVLSTDIIAFIDMQPIESFNINDYTYVIAEDLCDYGFDVTWDADARTLSIEQNIDAERGFMPMDKVNIKKSDVPFRAHVFDVYNTDIVTYIGGRPANAYNVNGQTLIMIDELSRYGNFSYDDASRCVKIDIAGFADEMVIANSEYPTIDLPCDKIEGKKTYTGELSDGKPNGLGMIHETYEFTNGLMSTEDYYYSGHFKNGEKDGYICYHGRKTPHNGSDSRVRDYYSLTKYVNGQPDGYNLNLTYLDADLYKNHEDSLGTREETNGSFKRIITPDPEYRYGYRIDDEGYIDSYGAIIHRKLVSPGKIAAAYAGDGMSFIKAENGDLYSIGYQYSPYDQSASDVPVKIDTNISSAFPGRSYDTTVIDNSGNLYYLWDKVQKYKNTDVPVVAADVKKAAENMFLTNDGKLYSLHTEHSFTMYDPPELLAEDVKDFSVNSLRLMYLKNDGSVWRRRLNGEESGISWGDGLDLSEPVKVFENAKGISCTERNLVIDANNTLWGWSSDLLNTQYEDRETLFTTIKPIKIAENVTAAVGLSSFFAYTKSDGALYVCPDLTEPDCEPIFGISGETKLLDDVAQFSASYSFILAVRSDGTLWVWGKNIDNLGIGPVKEVQTPTQITEFYEPEK